MPGRRGCGRGEGGCRDVAIDNDSEVAQGGRERWNLLELAGRGLAAEDGLEAELENIDGLFDLVGGQDVVPDGAEEP